MNFTELQLYAQSKNFALYQSHTWATEDGFAKPDGFEIECSIGKRKYVTWLPLWKTFTEVKAEIDYLAQRLAMHKIQIDQNKNPQSLAGDSK